MAQAAEKGPINVLISGAAGQIGYSLIPLFASGQVFGNDQPMNLVLLDIERMMKPLEGVVMEIDDGAYPLVHSVIATHKAEVGFKDLDYAILVGGLPRKQGQSRGDLLVANIGIFEAAGRSLGKYAKTTCKTLVVANPANSNCWVCAHYACEENKEFKKTNFAALTRLDMNRAVSQLSSKLKCLVRDIDGVTIWGNHSASQVPDIRNATNKGNKVVIDDKEWISGFEKTVQQRGAAVIAARGASSAMSAANGIKDCVRDWHQGTNGKHVAMAIYTGEAKKSSRNSKNSDGECKEFAEPLVADCEVYNLIADMAPDTYFSCPCVCENGEYKAVAVGGDHSEKDFVAKISATGAELVAEKSAGLAALQKK